MTQHDLISPVGLCRAHPPGLASRSIRRPPGTGKTICAEASAHALGRRLLLVRYASRISWMASAQKCGPIFRAHATKRCAAVRQADRLPRGDSVDYGSGESNTVVASPAVLGRTTACLFRRILRRTSIRRSSDASERTAGRDARRCGTRAYCVSSAHHARRLPKTGISVSLLSDIRWSGAISYAWLKPRSRRRRSGALNSSSAFTQRT